MAVNFRLSYNDGFGYTDLFLKTKIEGVIGNEKILKYTTLEVDIPTTTTFEQTVNIPMSMAQKQAPFTVELMTEGLQAQRDYSTIAQIETVGSGLKITRLGAMPKGTIRVKLTFREGGAG